MSEESCITITIKNEDKDNATISTDFGEEGMEAWEGTPAANVILALLQALKTEGAVPEEAAE